MDPWNKKEIAQPPNFTLEFVAEEWHENNIEKCVVSLTSGLSRLDASLCDEVLLQYFNTEAKVLKVLLGKNRKHRQEKFYGLLKKIFRCIERFQGLKLVDFVTKLRKMMPVIIEQFRSIRLPSRQMFEYLLARVYGAFQIFLTLETCCREVVPYLVKKVNIGHSYWNAITLLAVVARLRTLAIDFAGQLASVYDDIVPWLQHLKGGATLNLMAENPFYLMKKLEMHCKVAKHNKYSEIIKNASSVINESNVLDIFNDNIENSADLISSNSLCENKDKLDIKPQNNAKTTYTSKKKKKLRTIKNKSSSGTKNGTNGRRTDGDTFNNALNKQDIFTEKQQLLKLLDIFDDASEEASSHVLNKFQCSRDNQKESGIAADILSEEDIGECAESNRFRSKKQSSKRKKSFDNVKEGDCKISKKKKKKICRRNVTEEPNKISKKKKISRRNVTEESNKISKKKKISRRNVTEESNKISKKKKICRRNVTEELNKISKKKKKKISRRNVTKEVNDAQHNKTFRR